MSAPQPFGLPVGILQAFLNKAPKEGPRYVPMAISFATTTVWSVDLTPYVTQGKLSAIQCFFIDNSQNTAPVQVEMGVGGQTIQLDAGQQGWVSALLNNNPQFIVSSTGTSCEIFACNFQMFNAVWYAKGAEMATTSNITEVGGASIALGQQLPTASLPVANSPFEVNGTAQIIAVTTTSASATITAVAAGTIRLVNTGAVPVFVRSGTGAQTAVDTDICIPPNQVCYLASNSATTVAAICASGTATLNVAVGSGGGGQ